ncbi:choice-of-anchor I family protein [Actinotalea ferrariae]|nr:choice-of-anchor I family protein [Actinotalea ferrariae]
MPSPAGRAARPLTATLALALATSAALAAATTAAPPAAAAVVPEPPRHSAPDAPFRLTPVGTYESGVFDASAAEIVAFHAGTQRLFVVNAHAATVEVLDGADVTAPAHVLDLTTVGVVARDGSTVPAGAVANSVAVRADGLVVVAVESDPKTDDGWLVFFDAAGTGTPLGAVRVGALPDMVALSDDGAYAVVANEGEPDDDYTVDPEGSVSVVSLPTAVAVPAQEAVRTATFHEYEVGGTASLPDGVRVFAGLATPGPNPVSENLEPEYVTVDGATAYVTLQEANATAVVDLESATVTEVLPLGWKDHGHAANALDPSDRDGGFSLRTVPGLRGLYLPDGIESYVADGRTYLVTANEGDAREWGDYAEPARLADLGDDGLAPVCADHPLAGRTASSDLGRLNVTTADGLSDDGSCYEELYAFGGRSFSVWTTDGELVFDSGSSLEEVTALAAPAFANSNHSESNLEGRSDDKGPEPENLALGEIDGRTYAFVGLERVGGIAVYDITTPTAAAFVTYVNNRDFSVSVEDAADPAAALAGAGDLGPEGVAFIPAAASPTGEPLVAVGNEVSGTTTLFAVEPALAPTVDLQILGINDFHGRLEENARNREAGAAVLAGAVAQLRAENPSTVFVSAGDNIGASTFTSFSQQDSPTLDALAAAGLQISAVGNHEFDRGYDDLVDRVVPRGGFPQLGANVYLAGTTTPALPESWVTTVGGVDVGFVGVVTASTATLVTPGGIAGLEFGDALAAANRVAEDLQDGDTANGEADVVVLLAHEGGATDDCAAIAAADDPFGELVRGASERIDAIFSAHTHRTYDCAYPVAGWPAGVERPVVQSGQYGTHLGRVQLTVDRATNAVVAATSDVLPLHDGTAPLYPADPAVSAIVSAAVEEAEEVGSVVVGRITADITRARNAAGAEDRTAESSLGNLVADMQLWATSNPDFAGEPAQIAFMNAGGVRADLIRTGDGSVTFADVASVQPFANTLVTMDLTGAQLDAVLEQQWRVSDGAESRLHLAVSEGLSYTFDPRAPLGARVSALTLDGAPVASAATYRVVVNSFLASGGDGYTTFTQGARSADTGQVDLAASVAYFEATGVVSPPAVGRAVLAQDAPAPGGTGTGGAVVPGGSTGGSTAGPPGPRAGLATTGADVALLAALGALLVAAGAGLVRRAQPRATS